MAVLAGETGCIATLFTSSWETKITLISHLSKIWVSSAIGCEAVHVIDRQRCTCPTIKQHFGDRS